MDYTTGYEYLNNTSEGASSGLGAGYMIFSLLVCIFGIVCMWKVFKKAGKKGWEAIIPIYNMVVLFQICGINPWILLLALIPIIGQIILMVYLIIAYVRLAHAFGKSSGFAVGLIFLNIIFMAILAFDNSSYTGVPNK